MVKSNTSSWMTAMLSDSSLPVGGFVASAGLESALQQNLVSASSLLDWILQSLYFLHHQTCPFILEIYKISDCSLPEQYVDEIATLDKLFHVGYLRNICMDEWWLIAKSLTNLFNVRPIPYQITFKLEHLKHKDHHTYHSPWTHSRNTLPNTLQNGYTSFRYSKIVSRTGHHLAI